MPSTVVVREPILLSPSLRNPSLELSHQDWMHFLLQCLDSSVALRSNALFNPSVIIHENLPWAFLSLPFSCDSVYQAGTKLVLHDLLSMLLISELIMSFQKQESNLIGMAKKQIHPSSFQQVLQRPLILALRNISEKHLLLLMLLEQV